MFHVDSDLPPTLSSSLSPPSIRKSVFSFWTMVELGKIFSVSCGATFLMIFYMGTAGFNLYMLMFPLAAVDLKSVPEEDFVRSLWSPRADKMHLRVYLSTKPKFSFNLVRSEFDGSDDDTSVPDGFAWRLMRDAGCAYSRNLSQLLSP